MLSSSVCDHTREYTNRTRATRSSDFVDHSRDYRSNWIPFSPIDRFHVTSQRLYCCTKRSITRSNAPINVMPAEGGGGGGGEAGHRVGI